ncbi:Peptide deformylase [Sinobacterium norvegicum]|uniref:Peptide deformylase n=1 Tax=Sinobacterium norvegicum TaxID=1641715 RepID=A0ABM9AGB0_9GAMM|nr:peptide deformylase [Sinobacterium norvegicum]CAH0992030.1 Peptide deformylase [Sinobacterium norvegicum]
MAAVPSQAQNIAQLGEPVLRTIAEAVDDIGSQACQALIKQMLTRAEETGAMGLAAPQIFIAKRVIVISSKPNSRYPTAPLMTPMVMINPTIDEWSSDKNWDWEGCLSIPGIRAQVERSSEIDVSFYDVEGERQQQRYQGFVARIIQHEIDHLDGTVFIDRTDSRNIVTEQQWRQRLTDN